MKDTLTDEFLEGVGKAFVKAWRIDRGEWHDPEYYPAEFRQFCEDRMTQLLSMAFKIKEHFGVEE